MIFLLIKSTLLFSDVATLLALVELFTLVFPLPLLQTLLLKNEEVEEGVETSSPSELTLLSFMIVG